MKNRWKILLVLTILLLLMSGIPFVGEIYGKA